MKGWIAAIAFMLVVSFYGWQLAKRIPANADGLNQSIMEVIRAKNVAEREQALTESLEKLSAVNEVTMGNGNYYLALGDVYRQFNAHPFAMWSYSQAARLAPGHPQIQERMRSTAEQLQIDKIDNDSVFNELLFFHLFSLPRRLQLFTLFAVLSFAFASVAIWKRHLLWVSSGYFFGAIAAIFLLSVLYTRYLEPAEAILVEAAVLRGQPSSESAMIGKKPVSAGSQTFVMGVYEEGGWLRVFTADGSIGYLPTEKVRLVY